MGGKKKTVLRRVIVSVVFHLLASSVYADEEKQEEPFSYADYTWLNGNTRQTEFPLKTQYFTGEFSFDSNYVHSFNHPSDHTLSGSSNSGRTSEVQVQQLGVGGDVNYNHIRGRLLTQFGMYSSMTPRGDGSTGKGQWDLAGAYRYISEAYGGYHWDTWYGINLDVGIFLSYLGLCSYYNYDNWVYQMSYVSSFTPWYFNGLRLQMFPTKDLKTEFWLVNGWQSYGKYNSSPGLGFEVLWRPFGHLSLVNNAYFGHDTPGNASRLRLHSDTSIQLKYHDQPKQLLSKAALSLTIDLGCETGDGVGCLSSQPGSPPQYFLGFMFYNRFWFLKDRFAITLGGGSVSNPGRYLVQTPPINGATAASQTPYFSENPGDPFHAWDTSLTFDYMPSQFMTFRIEYIHRQADVGYFTGPKGITPDGGNQGTPGSLVNGFIPDLQKSENRINSALMIRI